MKVAINERCQILRCCSQFNANLDGISPVDVHVIKFHLNPHSPDDVDDRCGIHDLCCDLVTACVVTDARPPAAPPSYTDGPLTESDDDPIVPKLHRFHLDQ